MGLTDSHPTDRAWKSVATLRDDSPNLEAAELNATGVAQLHL